MSVFALKLIALISMFIDHSTFVFYMHNFISPDMYILLRGVGRLAFPIYCFLLVNGFQHTSNKQRYVSRLMLFAVISQIPFSLAFSIGNHYGAALGAPQISFGGLQYIVLALLFLSAYLIGGNRKVSHIFTICLFTLLPAFTLKLGTVTVIDGSLNVFFTLSLGLSIISLIDTAKGKTLSPPAFLLSVLAIIGAVLVIQPKADYGLFALVFICMLYVSKSKKGYQALVIFLWACLQYGFSGTNLLFTGFALLSLLPVLLYNGKKGPSLKYLFYIFYPAHLLILGLISFVL